MNCKIDYLHKNIESAPLPEGVDKTKLIEQATNAHRDIVKELVKDWDVVVHDKRKHRLYLKFNYEKDYSHYQTLLASRGWNKVVFFNDEPDTGKVFLSVNVLADEAFMNSYNINGIKAIPVDDASTVEVLQDFFHLPSLVNMKTHLESIMDEEEHAEKFKEFLDGVRVKLQLYSNSIEDIGDNYQVGMSKNEVNKLIYLFGREDVESTALGISKYTSEAVSKLSYLSELFFGSTTDQKLKDVRRKAQLEKQLELATSPTKIDNLKRQLDKLNAKIAHPPIGIKERLKRVEEKRILLKSKTGTEAKNLQNDIEEEVKDLNDLIQQGRYYYHLFDGLKDLHKEATLIDGNEKEIDKYNKDLLSKLTEDFIDDYNVKELSDLNANEILQQLFGSGEEINQESFVQYLNDQKVSNPTLFFSNLTEAIKEAKKYPSFIFSLKQALLLGSRFEASMNELYLDVFTTTFYPEYEKHFEEFRKNAKLNKEEALLEDKYFLEAVRFKELARTALKDADTISHLMRETVGLNDQMTQLMSVYIKDMLTDVRLQDAKNVEQIETLQKKLNWDKKSNDEKAQYSNQILYNTKAIKLDTYGRIEHIMQLTVDEADGLTKDEVYQALRNKAEAYNKATPSKENKKKEGESYIEIEMFGAPYFVKALDEQDVVKEYDDFKFRNEKLLFNHLLEIQQADVFKAFPLSLALYKEEGKSKSEINLANKELYEALQQLDTKFGINITNRFVRKNVHEGIEYFNKQKAFKAIFYERNEKQTVDFGSLKDIIRQGLYGNFYNARITTKNWSDVGETSGAKTILSENRIIKRDANGQWIFNYQDLEESRAVEKNLAALTNKRDNTKSTMSSYTKLESAVGYQMEKLLGIPIFSNSKQIGKRILVQAYDEFSSTFFYKELEYLIDDRGEYSYNGSSEELTNVTHFYMMKGELSDFTSSLKIGSGEAFQYDGEAISKHNNLKNTNDALLKEFYKTISDIKKESNNDAANKRLYGTPRVLAGDESTIYDKMKQMSSWKGISNFAKSLSIGYDEDSVPKKRFNKDTQKYEFLDDKDNVVEEAQAARISKTKYGVDRNPIDKVGLQYTEYIPPQYREQDLIHSFKTFRQAAHHYSAKAENLSKVNTYRVLAKGDIKAGITPRQAKKLDASGNPIIDKSSQEEMLVDATKLTKNIEAFIQDAFFGMSKEEYALTLGNVKIDMHKLTDRMIGLSSYQALALNLTAMPANHFISTIGNYSEASMGRHFDTATFRETYRELFVSVKGYTEYFQDYASNYLIDKSFNAQAAILFDAIQGEFLDPKGVVHTSNLARKFASDALFATSNAVEYTNQMLTMVCLMKGFKRRDANGDIVFLLNTDGTQKLDKKGNPIPQTLYNSAIYERGKLMKFEEWVTEDTLKAFTNLVQGINRQIHGNYKSADKNMLSRTWYGRLALMFKRWIYNTMQARFQGEQLDWEQHSIEEGYFRMYLKRITHQYQDTMKQQGWKGFTNKDSFGTYLKAIGVGVGKVWIDTARAAVNPFTLNNLKSDAYDKWMYGENLSEREKKAIMRTTAEMGLIVQIMLIGLMFHMFAAGEDDDKTDMDYKLLKWGEYYAFKMQAEMQFYTPFLYLFQGLPAGYTIDTSMRFLKDPLTMTRMIDVNLGLIRDLIGFDVFDENGEVDVNFHVNDMYDRSGKGYSKGDYKITNKIVRSPLAPVYQVYRLADPEQQLSYMDLIFKNN